MEGIGHTHFPVTTKVPEVQEWFDHGITALVRGLLKLGVSSVTPEKNKASAKLSKLPMRLLSDRDHENARRFASYDDFEELELHSTVLIDAQGRVHWKRTGGKPFADVEFLMQSVKRMNQQAVTPSKAGGNF